MTERLPLSPCVAVCQLDPVSGLCLGCWRTMPEIAGWLSMSADEKRQVLVRVAERRAKGVGT